jgi:hypothetical protein
MFTAARFENRRAAFFWSDLVQRKVGLKLIQAGIGLLALALVALVF